jgi:hypothetical protein
MKRIESYDDWKFDYLKKMSGKYRRCQKQKWGAIVFSFEVEFAKILESTVATGGAELGSDIDSIGVEREVDQLQFALVEIPTT